MASNAQRNGSRFTVVSGAGLGSGRRQATIPVPQGPCQATEVGAGAVWTATCSVPGLAKIDTERNRVARHVALPVSTDYFGEGSIGVGAGAVWLVTDGPDCTACRVSRVDAGSMQVTAEIPVLIGAASVRFGAGSVWVTNPVEDVVQRIDPQTRQVIRTIRTGRGPRFFDVGEGAAWMLDQVDGTVTRIDADTNRTVRIRAKVRGEGGDLTVGGGFVWARGTDKLLTRIDPKRRKIVARYGPPSGSGGVAPPTRRGVRRRGDPGPVRVRRLLGRRSARLGGSRDRATEHWPLRPSMDPA